MEGAKMANRCLILGEGGEGLAVAEDLWAEMLWLYVEEDVTEFVTEQFGRVADLAAYVIQKAGVRYSALRVTNLPWRADIRAAIRESKYLISLGHQKKMEKIMGYAQTRQAEKKMKIITISAE